ncbi:MAG: hypothetical protein ACPL3C_06060 [Pyrobaculum sp.]
MRRWSVSSEYRGVKARGRWTSSTRLRRGRCKVFSLRPGFAVDVVK